MTENLRTHLGVESGHVDELAVLIVGAGWIGRQVGLRMAICGYRVALLDRTLEVRTAAELWMKNAAGHYIDAISVSMEKQVNPPGTQPSTFDEQAARGWLTRVSFPRSIEELHQVPVIVLECVPEQIALKRRILQRLSGRFPSPTIIASNSSYFTPSTLIPYVNEPGRFAHWHFHVPLDRSSVVDISGTPATEPWVIEKLKALTVGIGQYPIVLRHEHSGYVFNWLLQSLLRSALELAAQDVVDISDIDYAWKAVSGMAIGPFAMMDNIGLDVIEQVLSNARWAESDSPVPIEQLIAVLQPAIQRGDLGAKTGRGFYDHPTL